LLRASPEVIAMGNEGNTVVESRQEHGNRRRGHMSRPMFQRRLAVTVSLTVFLLSSGTSVVLYNVLHHQARQRLIHPQEYVAEVGLVILVSALVFAGITAAAAGFWCLVMSHRICGPLVRLKRYMEEVADGRVPDVRPVRKNDELQDLLAAFSAMVEAVNRSRLSDDDAARRAAEQAQPRRPAEYPPQEKVAVLAAGGPS
jgi:HAMP domain-containing protein